MRPIVVAIDGNNLRVMPGFRPGLHVFLSRQEVDGRDISAFTRVFDALCRAMTAERLRMHAFARTTKVSFDKTRPAGEIIQ